MKGVEWVISFQTWGDLEDSQVSEVWEVWVVLEVLEGEEEVLEVKVEILEVMEITVLLEEWTGATSGQTNGKMMMTQRRLLRVDSILAAYLG